MSQLMTSEEAVKQLGTSRPEIYPLLAQFCDVQTATALRWLGGEAMPGGEKLISLNVFLDLCGYELQDWVPVPEMARTVAEVIGYRLLTADQVRDELGYEHTNSVYRIVLRGEGVLRDKQYRMERLIENFSKQIAAENTRWLSLLESRERTSALPSVEELRLSKPDQGTPRVETPSPVVKESRGKDEGEPNVRSTVKIIEALVALVDDIEKSDDPEILRLSVLLGVGTSQVAGLRDWLEDVLKFA